MATSFQPEMRTNHTTIFIAGAGHSGSTLLGLLLGSHPESFYAGEAAKTRFLGDDRKPEHKRVCKLCGPDCPVWGDFSVATSPDLYEQLAQRTRAKVVIDSTKNLTWLDTQTNAVRNHGGQPALIFLQRDGRAVINSRVRKYPERDLETLIVSWVQRMQETQVLFDVFDGPKTKVRYEELASAPSKTLRLICQRLGVPFDPAMLDFASHEHHVLGGNNGTQWQVGRRLDETFVKLSDRTRGYYGDHPEGIVLDLRWVDELPVKALRMFEEIAGACNAELAWPVEPATRTVA